jgi:glycosyltransferase involved in cell wall biosynthesis
MKRLILSIALLSSHLLSTEERPLVIVIPSYNNAVWYQRNLDTLFSQHYSRYRVIYIDDCSSDGTFQLVKEYIERNGQQHRTIIIHNTERRGALANHYKAIHMCEDNEIIVQYDGDDFWKHDQALARINQAYEDPHVWLTYGQYELYPPNDRQGDSRVMPSFVIKRNGYREYDWVTSAPRTFYAWLGKRVALESLLHHGQFFLTTCDLALMFPMLEMAAGRISFIPDILYLYNQTPQNDCNRRLQLQLNVEYAIRAQKKYTPLKHPLSSTTDESVSCLLVSRDNPEQLAYILTHYEEYAHGLNHCYILYETSDSSIAAQYKEIITNYTWVTGYNVDSSCYKNKLCTLLKFCVTPYILLTDDAHLPHSLIDISACAHLLNQTKAHGFYLTLDIARNSHHLLARAQEVPPYTVLEHDICAWQFYTGDYAWREYNTITMNIYRTSDLYAACSESQCNSHETFAQIWRLQPVDMRSVGLFFKQARG